MKILYWMKMKYLLKNGSKLNYYLIVLKEKILLCGCKL